MSLPNAAAIAACLFCGVYAQPFSALSQGTAKDVFSFQKELRTALENPYKYFHTGAFIALIDPVISDSTAIVSDIPADSIKTLLEQARARHSYPLVFVFSLLYASASAGTSSKTECACLNEAASLAFRRLSRPHEALRIFKAASLRGCEGSYDSAETVDRYIESDMSIDALLKEKFYRKDSVEKERYVSALIADLTAHPHSSLRMEAMKRLGDVYFDLKNYPKMKRWYLKVLQTDPSLRKTTPIGYRLTIGDSHIKRTTILYLFYASYLFLGFFLLRRIRSGGGIDTAFLFKRFSLFALALLLFGIVLFLADLILFKRTIGELLKQESFALRFTDPVVPLSFLDVVPRILLIKIFCIGLAPLLFATLCSATNKSRSRLTGSAALLVFTAVLWGHFTVASFYNEYLYNDGIILKSRYLYSGEIESLLMNDLDKVIKANPDFFFKSKNSDLRVFIRKNFSEEMRSKTPMGDYYREQRR
ncbi:MAG: hypothetical protein A2268_07400 [Candidatus Raymondbacteria bacterium RifOxyA12_full_50_37]|uniref:Uncharacterized protein n=1 Tax=Candidatus Raymondbacteria bacterium RIFOXYD12_FULL_49_13 TaxID=1817890 RepID=A0A1F7F653_UNCRA|nr:MAG: hypothetical protein A2268_07400 [Candidatus Raymondbacteria bacterium RifOxyA12_full_50_37]OGJ91207.1 MAG: hypothetical protein A2248_01545 [Candidatus Raymondbacteria bacterium RIFOXYA2_FULL_49_16]OGJ97605.1 MAG: hypothetical protein A2453_02310 [Candidatus Raymondbacteria bacterium RIFOXYC2_FULL_50_21]OGK02063.1 MAG: hypothetical protein A2519_18755 [Candidatus Raymondbacteria bacterium RIFOXYD12_FULL_49_13]OGK03225.1 MAG: hypothetical protein A2350_05235 [Candidatus Raymondbacteria 